MCMMLGWAVPSGVYMHATGAQSAIGADSGPAESLDPGSALGANAGSVAPRGPESDPGADAHQWKELKSAAYKEALCAHLDTMKDSRYSHLSEVQYSELRSLVSEWSHCLVIDGVVPTTVEGYMFDIDLVEGARPVRHQLPKYSPQEIVKERYHVVKEEKLNHLRIPTDEQKSEWATRTHVVWKKDDPEGSWVHDCGFEVPYRAPPPECRFAQ